MTIKEMQKIYSKIPHSKKKRIWEIINIINIKKLSNEKKVELIKKKLWKTN